MNPTPALETIHPTDPILAASHARPYPYYRQLQQGAALAWNAELGLWVASRDAVIRAVLAHPHSLVRPGAEPVPRAIAGSAAGAVYARLARMNDGAAHQRCGPPLRSALGGIDLAAARAATQGWAAVLARAHAGRDRLDMNAWMVDLPTYVVADLLGFEAAQLPAVAAAVRDFVACLSPLSDAAQLRAASVAAADLQAALRRLPVDDGRHDDSLARRIRRQAAQAGWDDTDAILANLLGLLSQTHDATAGLIGNAIVALIEHPEWQQRLRAEPPLSADFVREVCRHDAPIQNTRRFMAQADEVAGVALRAGDSVLLLLGAAGRDAGVHARPDEFLPGRGPAPLAGFGHGRHACPGQALALAIAAAAVDSLLALRLPLSATALGWRYRPSANARLPQFHYLQQTTGAPS